MTGFARLGWGAAGALLLGVWGCGGGTDQAGPPPPPPDPEITSIGITRPADSLVVGDVMQVRAFVVLANGGSSDWPVAWSTPDPQQLVVDSFGQVRAIRPGLSRLVVTSTLGAALTDTVGFRFLPRAVSIEISAPDTTVPIDGALQIAAVVRDSTGAELPGRRVVWGGGGAGTISASGVVTAINAGPVVVGALHLAPGGVLRDSIAITGLIDSRYISIVVGQNHACGITGSGRAFCWGNGFAGQLGTGYAVAATPAPVATGARFAALAAGSAHTCGVTPVGEVYCWGANGFGQVGTTAGQVCGTYCRVVDLPTLVAGLPPATRIWAGGESTCAQDVSGAVHCWGANDFGQLGRGTADSMFNSQPGLLTVASGITELTLARIYACTLASGGVASCWGYNAFRQLVPGDTVIGFHLQPDSIPGRQFTVIAAGANHTCGIVLAGDALCWGETVGDTLLLVPGGHQWLQVISRYGRGCGVATDHRAFCWSFDGDYTPYEAEPQLPTAAIGVGDFHACGLGVDSLAYCWGDNTHGKRGTGTPPPESQPYRVAGQP